MTLLRMVFLYLISSLPTAVYAIPILSLEDFPIRVSQSMQADPFQQELLSLITKGDYLQTLKLISEKKAFVQEKPSIHAFKIAALIGKNDFDLAKQEVISLLTKKEIPEKSFILIAEYYFKTGKIFESLQISQHGLEQHFNSANLMLLMGRANDALNRNKDALIYYQQAKKMNSKEQSIDAQKLNELIANVHLKMLQFDRVKELFTLDENEANSSIIHTIAKAKYLANQDKFNQAIALLENHQDNNHQETIALIKAQIFILSEQVNQALAVLDELDSKTSNSQKSTSLALRSLAYLQVGESNKAMSILQEQLKLRQSGSNTALNEAIIHVALGNTDEAVNALKQAPLPFPELTNYASLQGHLKPMWLGKVLGLAHFALDQGFYHASQKIVQKALEEEPQNIFLHLILAESYKRNTQTDLAAQHYLRLVEIMPESFSFRFQLAQGYEETGNIEGALNAYQNLSKERPNFILTQLAHSHLLSRLGRWQEARNTIEWSLNFKPDTAPLLLSLGWTLSHLNDFKALSPLLDKLNASDQVNPAKLLHLRGWVAYLMNKQDRAITLLSQAMNLMPGEPELCYHLGIALMAKQESSLAKNLLQQAMLFPEQQSKYGAEVEKILNELKK